MNRTRRQKLFYVAALLVLGLAVTGVWAASGWSPWALGFAAAALLVPGRVQGHYWREFFRGRRLQAQAEWDGALQEYYRFLMTVRRKPWIKKLIWLAGSFYILDVEAMTHNNIGGCQLARGRLDDAEREFRLAQEIDPDSPLPHYNLAIASELRGDRDAAESHLSTAKHLGYERTTIDQLAHKAGEYLAKVEGSVPRTR